MRESLRIDPGERQGSLFDEHAAELALAELAGARPIVAIDDSGTGAVVAVASTTTAEDVNFMTRKARGTVGVALSAERCDHLGLELQVGPNGRTSGHRLTVSVDARVGTTTGISAEERANTIRVLADCAAGPDDLVRPGHMFPTRTENGGVFSERKLPEAALDLSRLACGGVGASFCVVLDGEGEVARGPALSQFAARQGIRSVHVGDLVAYRDAHEQRLLSSARERIVTAHGNFTGIRFRDSVSGEQHLTLIRGDVEGREDVPVLLHAANPTEDLLESLNINGGRRITAALRRFAREKNGILVYHHGRDELERTEMDAVSQILKHLAPRSVSLLEAEQHTAEGLRARGVVTSEGGHAPTRPALEGGNGHRPGMAMPSLEMAI